MPALTGARGRQQAVAKPHTYYHNGEACAITMEKQKRQKVYADGQRALADMPQADKASG